MSVIIWSPEAEADLQGIYEYIALDSEYYAQQQINAIIDRTAILTRQPYMGRMTPEASLEFIREIAQGNYRIIYRTDHLPDIQIIRIFHSARLLKL